MGTAPAALPLCRGVSEKVLTQQLRQMEADGLISRRAYDEVPPSREILDHAARL
ncbi:winged helix-turn-helix transcriptional regulator [Mesorhizobium sp.]|uniref:winged helix-turn-helix transcriptional regulator n=1 Tax=Mesorhizobium sp. TaxID=1871066 RepID=UPI00338D74AE